MSRVRIKGTAVLDWLGEAPVRRRPRRTGLLAFHFLYELCFVLLVFFSFNLICIEYCLWRQEESVGSPGTNVNSHVDAKNQIWVPWENSQCC